MISSKSKQPRASREIVADPRKLQRKKEALSKAAVELESEISELDDVQAGGAEATFKREYDRMLKYNSLLIRRLNEQLKQQMSSRDIYALSTLMSQQREVINDLRSISDMSQQVAMIHDQATTPFVSDLTQLITDVYYQLRKLLLETSKPKETQFALEQLDSLIKQVGLGLQTSHGVLRQSIDTILIGPADTVKTKKKQR